MESLSENSIGILDGRYILMKKLGEGYSSQVYKVKDSLTNKIYAAKVFNEYEKAIEKEIEHNKIISQNINIEFPNFIKYITSSVGPFELKNGSQGSDTPKNKTYIIFELGTKGTLLYLKIFSIVSHINFGKLRYNLKYAILTQYNSHSF